MADKPFDLVLNSDDDERDSLYKRLAAAFPDEADFSAFRHGFAAIHRLDFATSGVVVVGLNAKAAKRASTAFEKRRVVKTYTALVRGLVAVNKIRVSKTVSFDVDDATGRRMKTDSNGKSAVTDIVVVARGVFRADGFPATRLLLRPLTGRRHQLRVHCADLGHTIVGDFVYSNKRDLSPSRMFLHASEIDIPNVGSFLAPDPFRDDFLPLDGDRNTTIGESSLFDDFEPSLCIG